MATLKPRAGPSLLLALLLMGCAAIASTSPTAQQSQSAAPAASTTPAATPSQSAEVTAAPLLFRDHRLAIVRVNNLNMRLAPSTSAPRLLDGDVPVTLDAGDRVLIIAGPVVADTDRWFAVAREEDPSLNARPLTVAWAAGGTLTDPWIDVEETGPCTTEPTLADLAAMAGILRLGCYASSTLTFDAHQAASPGGIGGACFVEPPDPAWLMCDNIYNWVNKDGSTDWLFLLRFDPASGITPTGLAPMGTTGLPLRITGHFSDPSAEDCVTSNDPESIEAMSQWLTCAARFVVESIEPGT